VGLLEVKKELDLYRDSIVYSSYELGMGRLAYAQKDFDSAKKHFENAFDATGASLGGITKLGQTRRFRARRPNQFRGRWPRSRPAQRCRQGLRGSNQGAQEDKRIDLVWPAQRGLGRSLWLQAQQENDAKKSNSLRESALKNYRDAIQTLETLRAGSLRADEARTTFLTRTKDVFDETASALAEMALLAAPRSECAALRQSSRVRGGSVSGNRTIALALATGSPERDRRLHHRRHSPGIVQAANRTTSIAAGNR